MLVFCFAIAAIPLVAGLYLLLQKRGELARMAGWLTVKPVIATPIWLFIVFNLEPGAMFVGPVVGILPAVFYTGVIANRYAHLLFGESARPAARLLLGLDCFRWLNSFVLSLLLTSLYESYSYGGFVDTLGAITSLVGMAMPTLYAVVALVVAHRNGRKRKRKRHDVDELVEL